MDHAPKLFVRIALALGLLLCNGVFSSAQEADSVSGTPSAIEFRRVFVPAGKDEKWPHDEFEYGISISLEEFEQMLELVNESNKDAPQAIPFQRIEYQGFFKNGILSGQCILRSRLSESNIGFSPLGSTNINLERSPQANDENKQATVGSLPDLKNVESGVKLNTESDVDEKLEILHWSFPLKEESPGVWNGRLILPQAEISDIHLLTLRGVTLDAIQGILLSRSLVDFNDGSIQNRTDWHLAPSGNGVLEIQISENENDVERNSLTVKQADNYRIAASEITVDSHFQFYGKIEASQQIQVSTDRSLIVSQVLMNNRPIDYSFAKDPITDQGKIAFSLSDSQLNDKAQVTIQCVAPILNRKKQRLQLPRLYLSEKLWESGSIEVLLSDSFELHRANYTQAELTDYLPNNGSRSKRLRFELFDPDAVVALQLEPLVVQNKLLMGTTLMVGENEFHAQVKTQLSTKSGDSFYADFIVANLWQVNSVQLEDEERLLDWGVTTKKRQKILRVRFAKPFSAITTSVLHVALSRSRASFPGYYSLRSITPLAPVQDSLHESWFAIKGEAPLVLQTDPHSHPLQLDSSKLSTTIQQLLEFDTETAIVQLETSAEQDYRFRAVRQNKSTATVSSNYFALPGQFKQHFHIELSDNDTASDYVDIQTDRVLPEGTKWFLNKKLVVAPNLLSGDQVQENGYPRNSVMSRIPLPISISFPLTLEASVEGAGDSFSTPYLLSVPNANTQTCTMKISTAENAIVTTNRRGIQKNYTRTLIDSQGVQTPYPMKVDTFSYRPSDLTRPNANTPEFFKIIWIENPLTSSLFVKRANHYTTLFNSGIAVHQTRYELISNQGGKLEVTFPPGANFQFAEVNGVIASNAIIGDRFVIDLPAQPGPVEVVINYQSRFQQGMLFTNYEPSIPQIDLPVGTSSHRITGLPNHSTAHMSNRLQGTLVGHLCRMILGDRLPDISGSLFEDRVGSKTILCLPGQSLRFWDLQTIYAVGYALFFLSTLSVLALRKQARFVGFIVLAVLILSATYLPISFYPITSNLFQGTILGNLVLLLSNQGWLYFCSNRESDRARTNLLQKSTPLIVLFLFIPSFHSAIAQDTRSSVEGNHPIYPVLIPIDEEDQSTGEVYLPASFHKLLLELTNKQQQKKTPWTLISSHYEFQVTASAVDDRSAMNFIATYQAESNQADQTVKIPLNQTSLRVSSVIVDDALIPVQWNAITQNLEVPLSEAGLHQVTITAEVFDVDLSKEDTIELSVVPCLNTKVSLTQELNTSQFFVEFDGNTLPFFNAPTIPLGSVDTIQLSWTAKLGNPEIDYDQIDLLSIIRGEVSLHSQFIIHNQGEPIQSIALWIDSRLRPLDTSNLTERVQVSDVVGEKKLLQIDFTEPITDSREIELRFLVDDASGIGHLRYPEFQLEAATRRQHLVGISAPYDFSMTSNIPAQFQVAQETFAQSWEEAVPDFREAFTFPVASDSQYVIQSYPNSHQATAETRHQITLHKNSIDLEFLADILITQGSMVEYALNLGPDFVVDDIYVSEDGLQRSVEWTQNSTTGEVNVLLLQPAIDQQQFSLVAHAKREWPSTFQFIPVSFDGIQVIDTQVSLSRSSGVRVERIEAIGLVDNGELVNTETIDPQYIPLSTFHSADEPCIDNACSIQIQCKQNNVTLSGEIRTIVGKINQKWSARIDCELEQREGRFDSLQFYLPKNLTLDADSVVGYQATAQPVPLAAGTLWTFAPLQPVAAKFRLSFIAQLNIEAGSRVEFSSVHLIGQSQLTRLVAIPSSIENREAVWNTSSLQSLAVSARWHSSRGIPQSFQIYQATRPFVCRLANRRTTIKPPEILLQDTSMQVDYQGNYYRVTNYHLVPNGSTGISFSTPGTEQLLYAYCDEQAVGVNRLSESEVYLALASRQLTQTITLVTKGQLKDLSENFQRNLIAPLNVQVAESIWSVTAPINFDLRLGREKTFDSFSTTKVKTLNQVASLDEERYALISATELELWSEVRESFLIQAIHQWQVDTLLTKEAYQSQLASALNGSTSSFQPFSQQLNKQMNFTLLESLFSQSGKSDSTTHYFITENADLQIHLTQPTTSAAHPKWQFALVWLGTLSILGFTLFVVRKREHLQLVFDWISRFPHILGLSAGILWWLFLSPSFIGLILIAIILCAAAPRWDISSLFGSKLKPYPSRRPR
ncbi:MAG: hypothetical protein COA78_33640 [Blastopirellula sp.]|nr:MAG: hypothetical protein COA78_33640 [Blastopirellula sp.]